MPAASASVEARVPKKDIQRFGTVKVLLVAGLVFVSCCCWLFTESRPPGLVPERVVIAESLRDLRRKPTWAYHVRVAVWMRLPGPLQDLLQAFAPQDILQVRRLACGILGELQTKSPQVIHELKAALGDAEVRLDAIRALAKIGLPAEAAVEDLINLVQIDQALSGEVYEALGAIAPASERVQGTLLSALTTPGGDLQAAASVLEANCRHYGRGVQERLARLVAEAPTERASLVRIIGKVLPQSSGTASLLLTYLRGTNDRVRAEAISVAPASAGANPEVVWELIRLLDSFNAGELEFALQTIVPDALGMIGAAAKDAVPSLERHFASRRNGRERMSVAMALWRIAGFSEPLREIGREGLHIKNEQARASYVWWLAGVAKQCPDVIPLIAGALDDESKVVRDAAVRAFEGLQNVSSYSSRLALIMNLDESRSVRERAAGIVLRLNYRLPPGADGRVNPHR